MKNKRGRFTRREFIELGASVAGVTIASFMTQGKASGAPNSARTAADKPQTRGAYQAFSPGRIGRLEIQNRLVRSATAEGASPDGMVSDDCLKIYRELSQGGMGLIITGHMVAAPKGDAHLEQTYIYDDAHIASIKKIADEVHGHGTAAGCKVVAQISHGGRFGMLDAVTPSEVAIPTKVGTKPRVLSIQEIEVIVRQFAQAVHRVKEAGFDGVEIHCAHGYLLSSFLSPLTNRRTDKYGGSIAGRATIVKEILAAARQIVGAGFPILVKMNCNDQGEKPDDVEAFVEMAREIEAGADAIDISGMDAARQHLDTPDKESYFRSYGEALDVKTPIILTGGHRSIDRMELILKKGKISFLGLARPFIREPFLPARWLKGEGSDEAKCISCNRCLGGLGKEPTHCVLEAAQPSTGS